MGEVWAVVPARAGSKGIPGKNLVDLAGLPLLAHSIRYALRCPEIDRVLVSTDDEAIAAVAREHGAEVPCLRPPALATDRARVADAVAWLVDRESRETAPDAVLQLYPTHPFRSPELVSRALAALERQAQVTSAVPLQVDWSRLSLAGAPLVKGRGPECLYQPTGGVIASVYVPPSLRADAGRREAWLREQRGPGFAVDGGLVRSDEPGACIDIDEAGDLAAARTFAEGAEPGRRRRVPLSACVLGLSRAGHATVKVRRSLQPVPDLCAEIPAGADMAAVRFHTLDGRPHGELGLFDLESGSLFDSIAARVEGGELCVSPDVTGHCAQFHFGGSPRGFHCDWAQRFSLLPLWTLDAEANQRLLPGSGAPIVARQQEPYWLELEQRGPEPHAGWIATSGDPGHTLGSVATDGNLT